MTVNEGLRAIAGAFVVLSVVLGVWVNPWFFAFTRSSGSTCSSPRSRAGAR
jgi:hypothetical protein